MPEPIDPTKDGTQDNNVVVDAFGSENKDPVPPKEGEDDKKKDDKGGKEPTLAELQTQLKEANDKIASMGGNLSGQRAIIDKLEKQIASKGDGKGAGSGEGEGEDTSHLPFKPEEIVFSKDLPKEKLDDMTENEIRLHDDLMKNREVMNKDAQARFEERKTGETKKVDDLNTTVRTQAKELAKGDEALANEIIESVKQFNLQGLTEDEVKARVENAYKILPSYKPPKEQVSPRGGKPVTGTEDKSDPFGTNKIVEDVASKRSGKTFDL